MGNCDMDNENVPMEYYTFVINEFYLPLISTDMMQMNSLWGSVEFGPLSTFEMYNDQGVQCMSDTYQRDLMAVQVVLKVYIEMCQLHLAIIREEMLETTGECPAGFEIGDWSDDSGKCCCDPSNQPIEVEDGEEPIEITFGGDGEEPIEITSGDGEEPIEITSGDGEEPILIPSGDGEEPVEISQGDGEEPVEIGGYGDGEEPVVIGGNGEEPVNISSGEEPVSLGSGGESPVAIGNGTTMLPSSSSPAIGSRRRGRRQAPPSTTTVGPTGQSPISIPNGYGGEEPVTVGYGGGEEPVTIGNGYGGEEPIAIDGGEEPVTIGGYGDGEEPIAIGGEGEEPMEITTGSFTDEQPMEVTGYGEGSGVTIDVEIPEGKPTPERPDERPAEKCFPKKKFCKCRSTSSSPRPPTGGPSGPIDIVATTPAPPRPTERPTAGPGTSPSGPPPTGPGPVPTGPAETTIFTIPSPISTPFQTPLAPTGPPSTPFTIPSLLPTDTSFTPSISTSTQNIPTITSSIPSTSDTASTPSNWTNWRDPPPSWILQLWRDYNIYHTYQFTFPNHLSFQYIFQTILIYQYTKHTHNLTHTINK